MANFKFTANPEGLFLLEIKRALPKVVILRGELAGKSDVCVRSSAVVVLSVWLIYTRIVKWGR